MNDTTIERKVSRRRFLKGAAASAGAVLFAGPLASKKLLLKHVSTAPSSAGQTETRYGVCRMCQQPYCSFQATVQDGVVLHIEGVPESPMSNGTLCARGNANIAQHYNPYRVKNPLRRTNPQKGMEVDPGWVEISWEEALNTVGEHLKKIRAEDPRRFVYNQGFSRAGVLISDSTYVRAFGSPNNFRSNGPTCALHYTPSSTVGTFLGPNYDFAYTKYVLNIGRNMGPSTGVSGGGSRGDGGIAAKHFVYSLDRGMQVVCVDPRRQAESSLPNTRWVPIRPGTELALLLALQQTIVNEIGVFDRQFVTDRTNAAYLIQADGTYLRAANGKPLLWDTADATARAFDDPKLSKPALEGQFTVNGLPVQPAFAILKANLSTYTAAWASKLTTVPAEEIRRIANELVQNAQIGATITIEGVQFPYRPVAVVVGRGAVSHKDGTFIHMAAITLDMLLGAVSVPGGAQGDKWGPDLKPDADGLTTLVSEAVPVKFAYPPQQVQLKEYYPNSHNLPHLSFSAILNPKKYGLEYTVDTLLSYGGNSIQHNCAPEPIVEAFKKIPFVVAVAYHLDEPTWMADVVLAEDSNFERYLYVTQKEVGMDNGKPAAFTQSTFQRPIASRLYNTRQPDDVFIDLAERAGFLYGKGGLNELLNNSFGEAFKLDLTKKYTTADLLDRLAKTEWGAGHGIDEKAPYLVKWAPFKDRYGYSYFPGRLTKHRIYWANLLEVGRTLQANLKKNNLQTVPGWEGKKFFEYYVPLPKWIEDNPAPADYPLQVVNWKTPQFIGLVGGVDNVWLNEVGRNFDPLAFGVCMNAATATKYGLTAGDQVVVESRYGSTRGKLIVTQLLHPEAVGIAGNLGRVSPGLNPITLDGPNYNRLLTGEEGMIDPIAGSIPISQWVRVRKA